MSVVSVMQTLQDLTESFGIPDALAFEEKHGLLFANIAAPGASASLCLQGGHLLHWQPVGHQPVLFLSQKSEMAPGKAIRGGIPLLFPWFGPRQDGKEGPPHGFARTQAWKLEFAAIVGEDVHLTLTQAPTDLSRSLGFDHFNLAFQITIGRSLRLQLTVHNAGEFALLYEEGMHTYFAVQDVEEITVTGLDGTSYIDKKDNFKVKPQVVGPMRITQPTDRVYLDTIAICRVHDPALKRTITIEKTNSQATVVWNPWAEMPDIEPGGWHDFICVETVNVGEQAVTLAPGQTHTMESHITVSPA